MFLVISIFQNDYTKLKPRKIYKTKIFKVVDSESRVSVKKP